MTHTSDDEPIRKPDAPERIWIGNVYDIGGECMAVSGSTAWQIPGRVEYVRADIARHSADNKILSAKDNSAQVDEQTQGCNHLNSVYLSGEWHCYDCGGNFSSDPLIPKPDAYISQKLADAEELERLRAEVGRLPEGLRHWRGLAEAESVNRALADAEIARLTASLSQAREDALEDAARFCERMTLGEQGNSAPYVQGGVRALIEAAEGIRSLKPPQRPTAEAPAPIPPSQVSDTTPEQEGVSEAPSRSTGNGRTSEQMSEDMKRFWRQRRYREF